jgi:hypothetical protein
MNRVEAEKTRIISEQSHREKGKHTLSSKQAKVSSLEVVVLFIYCLLLGRVADSPIRTQTSRFFRFLDFLQSAGHSERFKLHQRTVTGGFAFLTKRWSPCRHDHHCRVRLGCHISKELVLES